jgi:hypothetical protein
VYLIWGTKLTETTTIRISKKTAQALEALKENLKAKSLDEAIQTLIKKQRKAFFKQTCGIDKGKLTPFTEEDRLENRN